VVVSTVRAVTHGTQLQRVLPTFSASAAPPHTSLVDVSKPVTRLCDLLSPFNTVLELGRKIVNDSLESSKC